MNGAVAVNGAAELMHQLERAGFKTYIVGGAVRNKLLGIPQKDIDLVTLGSPEDVCRVAADNRWKTHLVGRQFGIVVVVIDGIPFEVAAARRERYGRDSHRPEEVTLVDDIREDLARRDFTVNAIAMDSSGNLIDPFGGRLDLEQKIIRAVGDPLKRFSEDGLRSFRAVRFAAQLGFKIEPATLSAIHQTLYRVQGLSVERVYGELEKILLASNPGYGLELLAETGLAGCSCTAHNDGQQVSVGILGDLLHLRGLDQNPMYHAFDAWRHTLAVVDAVPAEAVLRWAALFHDAGKGKERVRIRNKKGKWADHGHARVSAEIAREVLARFKAPRSTSHRIGWLVDNHMSLPQPEHRAVVKWLKKRAGDFSQCQELEQAVEQLLILCRADMRAGKINPDFRRLDSLEKLFAAVLREIPFYHADLAIGGREVADRLGSGPQVGKFLDTLLEKVQNGELVNNPDKLKKSLDREYRRTISS